MHWDSEGITTFSLLSLLHLAFASPFSTKNGLISKSLHLFGKSLSNSCSDRAKCSEESLLMQLPSVPNTQLKPHVIPVIFAKSKMSADRENLNPSLKPKQCLFPYHRAYLIKVLHFCLYSFLKMNVLFFLKWKHIYESKRIKIKSEVNFC